MNTIIINGQRIQTSGNNISVIGDSVFVDGQKVQGELSGIVEVQFVGDVASVQSDSSVTVKGNVQGSVRANGSVTCGNVGTSVDAGGSINCDDVKGNVSAGGSVNCDEVHGSVRAGGSVRHG